MRRSSESSFVLRAALFILSAAILASVLIFLHRSSLSVGPLRPGKEIKSQSGTLGLSQADSGYHRTGPEENPYFVDPFCLECHGSPPHQRKADGRAILNYHTTTIHCLTCHGQPFIEYPAGLTWKEAGGGKGILWPTREGIPLTAAAERDLREKVIVGAGCFPVGPDCRECHRENGILDLIGLGYEPDRAGRLTRLEEFLLGGTGRKWFFPESF